MRQGNLILLEFITTSKTKLQTSNHSKLHFQSIKMVDNATPASPPPTTGGRRRSSTASEKFAALEAIKRQNERAAAARASFSDQQRKPGFLGQMWMNFTRGPISPPDTK
ncbi:hypothetical protein IWZ01DRAFT_493817 [Phyllosticta capitalensis]